MSTFIVTHRLSGAFRHRHPVEEHRRSLASSWWVFPACPILFRKRLSHGFHTVIAVSKSLSSALASKFSFVTKSTPRSRCLLPSSALEHASGRLTEPLLLQNSCEVVVITGDPREVIPKFVAKHPVDIVVVGTRGLGTMQRWGTTAVRLRAYVMLMSSSPVFDETRKLSDLLDEGGCQADSLGGTRMEGKGKARPHLYHW